MLNDGVFSPVGDPIDPSDDDPTQPATLGNIDPLEGPLEVDGAFAVGADISDASALFTGFEWVVSLDFTREGDDKFAAATREAASFPIGDPRYYPPMEEALNDHNVAVYTIDLNPLGSTHLQAQFLNQLANDTGGYYYEDSVSFLTPLRRISKENSGYYLLSYQSEHPASEAGFQKVEVKARDKAVKVRARKGYRYGVEKSG